MSLYKDKIESKSDFDLIEILIRRKKYQPEEVEIAIEEARNRGLIFIAMDAKNFDSNLTGIRNKLIVERKRRSNELHKKEIAKKANEPNFWGWLPKPHVYDLVGYYSFILIFYYLFSFPFDDSIYLHWFSFGIVAVIPLWQGNTLATDGTKRSIHFHQRSIYAIAFALLIALRSYFVLGEELNGKTLATTLLMYVVFLACSGLVSFAMYVIKFKKLATNRWYFIHKLRIFFPVAMVLTSFFVVLKEGWFIEEKTIKWDEDSPLPLMILEVT